MRYPVWRIISFFGYLLGLVFLVLGLYGYLYYKTTLIGQIGLTFNRYQNYALPILIAGVVLMLTGFVVDHVVEEKTKVKRKQKSLANTDVCPHVEQ